MNNESEILAAVNDVKDMLDGISTENGFNTTPSVIQGWLQQHLSQKNSRKPVTFPVLVYRPELSSPNGEKTHNANIIDDIILVIDGAISVKNSSTPVNDLLNLIKDVRRSLVFDPDTAKLKISKIVFMECPFDIPEAGEEYAFFSQKISFKVVESYA